MQPTQSTSTPKIVQTQDYDYRISTHLVMNSTARMYVTAAGNYTFAKLTPWALSYTSLWGNNTNLSTYGIEEGQGDFLTPGLSTVLTNETNYTVNSTELNAEGQAQGFLTCTYGFGQTPEETTCKYDPLPGTGSQDFNILWANSGDFVSVEGNDAYQVAAQNGLEVLGNYTQALIGPNSIPSTWNRPLDLDWNDAGTALVSYGELGLGFGPQNGILVQFATNQVVIDPSISQQTTCGFSDYEYGDVYDPGPLISCSLSSSVTSGDLVVVALADAYENSSAPFSISDTRSSSWTQDVLEDYESGSVGDLGPDQSCTSSNNACFAAVYSATLPSSGTETVTDSGSYWGAKAMAVWELSGVSNALIGTATNGAENTCSNPCDEETSSSVSFSSYGFLVGVNSMTYFCNQDSDSPLESGYTVNDNGRFVQNGLDYVYSVSGVSSPTEFGIKTESSGYTYNCNYGYAGAAFAQSITQPITATLRGSGPDKTVTTEGCSASPASFTGSGSVEDLTVIPSCELTLSLPAGYIWQLTGTRNITGSTSTSPIYPSYMKAIEATLNPANYVNLTSSVSSVFVSFYKNPYNRLVGNSCGAPPCTPNTEDTDVGGIGFQFNINFPHYFVRQYDSIPGNSSSTKYVYCGTSNNGTCGTFTVQAVISFDANGTCHAVPQGASSSPPAPKVTPVASFSCGSITGEGDNFEWVVDNSTGYFANIKLLLNGATKDMWNDSNIFDVKDWPGTGNVDMKDAYAFSVFTGLSYGTYNYSNDYGGTGTIVYSGAKEIYCDFKPDCIPNTTTLIVTGEYSDTEYTSIPASVSSSNQTFDAGTFVSSVVDSAHVSNPSYIVGPPTGNEANMLATTSGSSACIVGAFAVDGSQTNGTIAILGSSSGGYTSAVNVAVSTSRGTCSTGTWTTIYSSTWNNTVAQWFPIGSITETEYIKVSATYSGSGSGGADVYIGGIAAFMGSYAQEFPTVYESSTGVTNPSNVLGIPSSSYAVLQPTSSHPSAWINASLGSEYSGQLVIYARSVGGSSSYNVQVWSPSGWTTSCSGTLTSSVSVSPIACGDSIGSFGASQVQYILITVNYSAASGYSNDLDVYGVYVA